MIKERLGTGGCGTGGKARARAARQCDFFYLQPPASSLQPLNMATKRPSLGRGLGALLGQPAAAESAVVPLRPEDELQRLPVDLLQRGKYQPRIDMRQETLQELADSIKAQGVVQPIVVRPLHDEARGPAASLRDHRRRASLARRADRGPA